MTWFSIVFSGGKLGKYLDEVYYIDCGTRYILGEAPYLCNFEHPPFARYLIGFLHIFGVDRVFFLVMHFCCCLLVFLIGWRVSGNVFIGFATSLFLALDTLFVNVFRFLLLDPVSIFFSLLALYLFLEKRYMFSAVFLGLAIASKFSAVPFALGIFLLFVYRRDFRRMFLYILSVFVVYISTYSADMFLGFDAVVRHHVDMFRYMSWKHGFSLPIAANGFLKLLTKVEVWRYVGEISIVLGNVSGTYSVLNQSFISFDSVKLYTDVNVGMGSVVWHLFFPLLLYTTYLALVDKSSDIYVKALVLFSWLSLLNIVAGPMDWYYIHTLPFLYINTVLALDRLLKKRAKLVLSILIFIQLAVSIATISGYIPFRYRSMW